MSSSADSSNEQLKRAYLALDKLKQRLQENEAKSHEPIAIVGMGCRFPGGADTPEAFWQLLSEGRDGLREVPADRWDMDKLYSQEQGVVGKMYTRKAAFLDRVGDFEPEFFGLSPREAKSMDPQQRVLLEVVWEALENANIIPEHLRESDTGMFLGIGQNDYGLLQLYSDDYAKINSYDGSGNGFCFASGRVSYAFGWQGPCLSVDTACSSSLVAVHLACQALRKGESKVAVAAGVQLMLTPNIALFLSRVGALAADGRSKAFSADADGYGRGEGCGAVVLKRLTDAQADGDEIVAVIRGSAVNHDGPGSGLTVPNGLAQQKLLRKALKNARVKASQVSFVEAHGTGTVLGDPIEAEALGSVYSERREENNPLYIGSVKTNVGHLETAAGIVSLIKTALALKHRQLPASLNFSQPNPHIPWQKLNLKLPEQLTPWQAPLGDRFAGVSSFGMSGTNAHLVLQQAPQQITAQQLERHTVNLLTLSAKHQEALHLLASRYVNQVAHRDTDKLADVCYTANQYRSAFSQRLAMLVKNPDQLDQQLNDYLQGQANLFTGSCSEWRKPKVAFLFTGQGAQFPTMGKALYASEPVFRQAVQDCDAIIGSQLEYSAYRLLCDDIEVEVLNRYAQPALFVLQYALIKLWNSWGVEAQVLIGHSVGEYAAACHAGVFSLADGLNLIIARSQAINQYAQPGGMLAVAANVAKVQQQLEAFNQRYPEQEIFHKVAIATINAPRSCVISGLLDNLNEVSKFIRQQGLSCQPLNVAHGFHSPAMQSALQPFAEKAAQLSYSAPLKNMISTLTGKTIAEEIAEPNYWVEHIRQTVKFNAAMEELFASKGVDICLEIGPKPILTGLARQSFSAWKKRHPKQGIAYQWIKSLSGKIYEGEMNGRADLLSAVAQLYCHGVELNWQRITPGEKTHIPCYRWDRKHYWVDTESSEVAKEAQQIESKLVPAQVDSSILQDLCNGKTQNILQQLWSDGELNADEERLSETLLQRLGNLYRAEQAQGNKNKAAAQLSQAVYTIDWQPYQQEIKLTRSERRRWMIIADQNGKAEAFARQLKSLGYQTILLQEGEQFAVNAADHYTFPLSESSAWQQFFNNNKDIQAAIDFRYCDLNMSARVDMQQAAQYLAVDSALLNALKRSEQILPLWFITQDALSRSSEKMPQASSSLPQSAPNNAWLGGVAWGFGRVLAVESGDYFGGLVELQNDVSMERFAELMLWLPQGEQIMLRDEQLYVARLQAATLPEFDAKQHPLNGDYLITGGLGGLGLAVATWLLETHPQTNLCLVSRREPDADGLAKLEKLQQLAKQSGARISIFQADISDANSVNALFEKIAQEGGELKGIIHAAGILADGSIESHTAESYEKLMAAKVLGAWNLHQASQHLSLDSFVLFSSAAAVLGSPGQANYAAANAAMDGLADYRNRLQLTALSINWGAWADAGMVTKLSNSAQKRMQANGVVAMPSAAALGLLGRAMASQQTQLMLMDIDWQVFSQTMQQSASSAFWQPQQSLYEGVLDANQPIDTRQVNTLMQNTSTRIDFIYKVQDLHPEEQYQVMIQETESVLRDVLCADPNKNLDIYQGFFDMGLDSMTVIEMREKLQQRTDLNLPSTLLFDFGNLDELAKGLLNLYQQQHQQETETTASAQHHSPDLGETYEDATPSMDEQQVQSLSEQELDQLISEKLESL